MAFNFILMLTSNDRTIPDAEARLAEALEGGARHIGFKNVGLPFDQLKGLADTIRAAGGRSYLEVVSLDEESELASARAAVDLDVDCLLGGTRADQVTAITRDHPVRYHPFPGLITGHPSVLEGAQGDIVESARRLADLEHVHGLDLLAYRYDGDVRRLMGAVCSAVAKPVVMAGSIDREARVIAAAEAGAAGFTVGTAALEGVFPTEGEGFVDQVRAILAMTGAALARSTAPRRIAIVAHNARKSHLRAWVLRHVRALTGHRLICTGGTGEMITQAAPELTVQRLQRGTRGGDQQLGALVATGECGRGHFLRRPRRRTWGRCGPPGADAAGSDARHTDCAQPRSGRHGRRGQPKGSIMTKRKGIVLAGGSGTRLFPVTRAVSKQLLPLYDKPMIYYPLSVLMLAGIREIAVITTPEDQAQFQRLLGDGGELGLSLTWIVQPSPDGLAQAYLLAEDFLAGAPSAMVLGDNIFYGHGLPELLAAADNRAVGGTVFGYQVADPERYGVVAFDEAGRAVSIEEKPAQPRSQFAVTGLYFLDGDATSLARDLAPSARGELEITSLLEKYLERGTLHVELMGRGYAWLDTGTHESLIEAASFVRTIEQRQGLKIGCPEEIAYRLGFIDRAQLARLAEPMAKTAYGAYLREIAALDET